MNRPKIGGSAKRSAGLFSADKRISVRITPYIHKELEEIARSKCVSISIVIRAFLLYGIKKAEAEYGLHNSHEK